jgi:hypothetical protein
MNQGMAISITPGGQHYYRTNPIGINPKEVLGEF